MCCQPDCDLLQIRTGFQGRQYGFDRPIALLAGNDLPFFTAWGNHDGSSDAVIRKFTDLPSKDRGDPYHAGYGSYAFDYAGCHFICIDYLKITFLCSLHFYVLIRFNYSFSFTHYFN